MLSRMRKRMTYANVTVTLALIFAMSGGAYAAKHYVIASIKQIKPKVVSELRGKPGPPGQEGKSGTPGAPGKDGTNGTNGKDGVNGVNGVSVTSKALTTSDEPCNKEGGSEFTSASGKTVACNGSPWTVGGVLPPGKSETGQWAEADNVTENEVRYVPFSYPIPLTAEPSPHLIRAKEGEGEESEAQAIKNHECGGTVAAPSAGPGNLCVFEGATNEILAPFLTFGFGVLNAATGGFGAGKAGAVILLIAQKTGLGSILGTWAVTASE